jgi:hypothetical protein
MLMQFRGWMLQLGGEREEVFIALQQHRADFNRVMCGALRKARLVMQLEIKVGFTLLIATNGHKF